MTSAFSDVDGGLASSVLPLLHVGQSPPTEELSPRASSPSPRDPNLPSFTETLGPSFSPRSSPVSSPLIPPLQPGAALLSSVGRPFLQSLAERHRPVVYLHSGEEYRPCHIEYFLQHADLYHGDTLLATAEELTPALLGDAVLLEQRRAKAVPPPTPAPTGGRVPRASKAVRHGAYNLRVRESGRGGLDKEALSSMPVYCYVREYPAHWELLYVFCYAFNGPYRVCWHWLLGAHDGDFEHVTLRVSKASGALTSAYYAAHGWRDGQWRHAPDIPTRHGRPLVYVARGSHATYPAPGRWLRIWAAANDHCDAGVEWDPSTVVLLHVGEGRDGAVGVEWLRYAGWWEFEGINSVHNQRWWFEEPTTSNRVLRRMFCSFVPDCLGMRPEMWGLRDETSELRARLETPEEPQ